MSISEYSVMKTLEKLALPCDSFKETLECGKFEYLRPICDNYCIEKLKTDWLSPGLIGALIRQRHVGFPFSGCLFEKKITDA